MSKDTCPADSSHGLDVYVVRDVVVIGIGKVGLMVRDSFLEG